MKRILLAAMVAASTLAATIPAHAAHVGVSIGFAQPGLYGRVDIGRFGAPRLVSRAAVTIGAPVYGAQPVYLWVPPEHRARWADYCASYGACGMPVYFVDDGWYRENVYVQPGGWRPPVVSVGGYYGGGYYRGGYYGGGWRDGYWRDGYWHDRDGHGLGPDGHPHHPYYPYPPGPPGHGQNGVGSGGTGGNTNGGAGDGWHDRPGNGGWNGSSSGHHRD